MKKFQFSLNTVLHYKEQVLEALRGEHAAILARVREQEARLEAVQAEYRDYNEEFCRRKAEGLTILDAMTYENGLRVLERRIAQETDALHRLQREEEAKRAEVIEAKKDTRSPELLREKKLDAYRKAEAKAAELLIEEFVSNSASGSKRAAS